MFDIWVQQRDRFMILYILHLNSCITKYASHLKLLVHAAAEQDPIRIGSVKGYITNHLSV